MIEVHHTTVVASTVADSEPRPAPAPAAIGRGLKLGHQPGLDGVRGAAVAAVLLFHGGFTWATGGYLGVSTFFTLSGFLITGLLLFGRDTTGRVTLRRFWERRFRRLLPALLVTLLGVGFYAVVFSPSDQLADLRHDALATLLYVANWRFIFSGQSYTDLFAAPNPLLHVWSLAIEEQFYVLFPLLVAGALALSRGRHRPLAIGLGILTAASVVTSVVLHDDSVRVYYGTDTRAAELLLGGLLAIWVAGRGHDLATRRRPVVAGMGVVALFLTVVAWSQVDRSEGWLYVGGFAAYALLSVALVAASVAPGPVRRLFSFEPLRWLGLVSYGVYLYHWPVFLVLTPARTDLSIWPLFGLRLVVTLAIAVASYFFVEQPIRRGALPGWRAPVLAPMAMGAVAVLIVATTVVPSGPSGLVAESSLDPRPSHTSAFPFVRAASSAAPLRVLLVGDSVSYDAEPGIRGALDGTGAVNVDALNLFGFGLTSGTYDWRNGWAELVRAEQPDLVVAMFGGWDEELATEQPAAYAAMLDEAVGVLTSQGSRLLFIGLPVSVDRDGNPLPRPSHDALKAAAERHPGLVAFIDGDDAVSPDGVFVERLPGPTGEERVRKVDGTHLCPAGAARFGRLVLDAITETYALPAPDPSWRAGSWASDPRFTSPPGICPD